MYKYYAVLQNNFDGRVLSSHTGRAVIQQFRRDIKKLKPKLIFCRGDWLNYYEVAIEQRYPIS